MNQRRLLWGILALGAGLRLAIVVADPRSFDVTNLRLAADILRESGLSSYGPLTEPVVPVYPYPPLYLGWVLLLPQDAAFGSLVRLPPIAADLTLAWLVAQVAPLNAQIPGAALMCFGPVIWDTSAAQGQIDAIAILPAFVGALVWHSRRDRRALMAGLLIGIGAAMKMPAVLVVFGLLPTARSWREAAAVLATAVAIPLLLFAPFAVRDLDGVIHALSYHGVPRFAGYAVILGSKLTAAATDASAALLAGALVVTVVILVRRRIEPLPAAAVVLLVAYVAGVHWSVQYLLWSVPFLLAVGLWREVLLVHVLCLGLLLRLWSTNWSWLGDIYASAGETVEAAVMTALYVVWAVMIWRLLRASRAVAAT